MASGEWITSERMLLAASINGAPPTIGLNDVVVEKVENQRDRSPRHLDRRRALHQLPGRRSRGGDRNRLHRLQTSPPGGRSSIRRWTCW